jgi:hypothetical protein
MPGDREPQRFYRWVDANGTVHVVSSLDAVPAAERARMEEVPLPGHAEPASPIGFQPDWGSVALGLGAGLLLALVLPRGRKGLTRTAVVLGLGALLVGGYLATLRRTTGADSTSAWASPRAIIEDAKAAVEKANEVQRARERELEQIRKEGG